MKFNVQLCRLSDTPRFCMAGSAQTCNSALANINYFLTRLVGNNSLSQVL